MASAGNIGFNIDTNPIYPQSYDLDNIIVVGGLDKNDSLTFWSDELQEYKQFNYGPNSVDIYAPAINIYSTLPNDTYGIKSGTSFAAPYVSGVAALLLSIKNDLTPAQLKECIVNGGDDIVIYPLNGDAHTVKKLNAFGARYDSEGRISNYDEMYAAEVAAYNRAIDSGDEAAIEAAEERYEDF